MPILQWNIFLVHIVTVKFSHSPISVTICDWKSNTSIWKIFLCCQTKKSGEVWLLFGTFARLYVSAFRLIVWGSNQSAAMGKLTYEANSSGHQANTSSKAKIGLVKSWHIFFHLARVPLPALELQQGWASSSRMRAKGQPPWESGITSGELWNCISPAGCVASSRSSSLLCERGVKLQYTVQPIAEAVCEERTSSIAHGVLTSRDLPELTTALTQTPEISVPKWLQCPAQF